MDRIELEKRVEELNQLLHEYGHAYYVLDKPLVSDAVYDQYMQELLAIEAENPDLDLSRFPIATCWWGNLDRIRKSRP